MKDMHKRSATALLVLAILLALTQVYGAQSNSDVDRSQYGPDSDGNNGLSSTLGQCVPGPSIGGDTALQAGFWQGQADGPTNVVLASFSAKIDGMAARIRWETASEEDLVGFYLHRAETPTGDRTQITASIIPGKAGDPKKGAKYEWLDETIEPYQVYVYWLEAVHDDDTRVFFGPVAALPPCVYEIFLPLIQRQHLEP
jgi:hypothetical protein